METTIEPKWMSLGIHAKGMTINQLSELMEKIADALRVSMDDFRKSGDYK